jgi:hypothetical protein
LLLHPSPDSIATFETTNPEILQPIRKKEYFAIVRREKGIE